MTDIDLSAPPAVSRRELLEKAYGELGAVVWYGLHAIHDQIDRDHLKRALDLLQLAMKEDRK